jgi:p-aminobenzoyl-glutamate transporter AbgT
MYFLDVDFCGSLGPVIKLLTTVFKLLQWGIPIVLILLGAIDLGKAVMASKEDEMKKAQSTLIKRVVYAVVIFFLFTIVGLVMGLVGDSETGAETESWSKCWNKYYS